MPVKATISFLIILVSETLFVAPTCAADYFFNPQDREDIPGLISKANEKMMKFKKKLDIRAKKLILEEGTVPTNIISYGQIGSVYDVNDPDIATWGSAMVHSYFRVNPFSKKKIKEQVYNVNYSIPRTQEERSYRVDMSIVLKEDKYIEMGRDFGGRRLLAPKGTKINPFDYIAYPYTLWFLNEGDDRYFEEAMKNELSFIVVVNGNLKRISDKHPGIKLFKASGELLRRMVIRSVPAMASVCKDEPLLCVRLLRGSSRG